MSLYPFIVSSESDYSDLSFSFEKKYTKQDKLFIKLLLNSTSIAPMTLIELNKSEAKSAMNFESDEELYGYINRFMQKRVGYSFSTKKSGLFAGSFFLVSSFFITTESVKLSPSGEFLMAFRKDSFFGSINFLSMLKFENTLSINVYLKFLNSINNAEGKVTFSIEEFKDIVEIEDSYERFYDFEKNIVVPILNDLNNYSDFSIDYTKVKSGTAKSSRIMGIELNYVNKNLLRRKEKTNKLLSQISDRVEDYSRVYSMIYDALEYMEYSQLNTLISDSKKSKKRYIDASLSEQLTGMALQKNDKPMSKNTYVIEKEMTSNYVIHQEINKALAELGADTLPDMWFLESDLYKAVYSLKDNEHYTLNTEHLKITVYCNLKKKSRIEIIVK